MEWWREKGPLQIGRSFGRSLRARWRRWRGRDLVTSGNGYDRQTIEVMRRVLGAHSTAIDVGAHRGELVAPLLRFAPRGKHHAFEALPVFAAHLRSAFPQVQIHEVALGAYCGESEFQFVENDPAYSGLQPRLYDRPDPVVTPIRVRVATLDSELPTVNSVALIKLDIEGGEYHAIQGGLATIQRCRPVLIFEGGTRSTGQYGVTAEDMYQLIVRELRYDLSTMARWLAQQPSLAYDQFLETWTTGSDYYFIATPRT